MSFILKQAKDDLRFCEMCEQGFNGGWRSCTEYAEAKGTPEECILNYRKHFLTDDQIADLRESWAKEGLTGERLKLREEWIAKSYSYDKIQSMDAHCRRQGR